MAGYQSLVLALVALSATGAVASYPNSSTVANKLIVSYNTGSSYALGSTNYYELPRTSALAEAQGWVETSGAKTLMDTLMRLTAWCPSDDYHLCIMYDHKGSVAGMKISVSRDEIEASDLPFEYSSFSEFSKHTIQDTDVWSTTTYFVDETILIPGGRTLTDDDETAPAGIMLLQGLLGSNVPIMSTKWIFGDALSSMTEQGCVAGLGQHYYQYDSDTACTKLKPYFLTYGADYPKLTGFGVSVFGQITGSWIEKPTATVLDAIIPNQPSCLDDLVSSAGLTQLHVYFVPEPWTITC